MTRNALMKFKRNKTLAVHRLPYVGKSHAAPNVGLSFWDVPLTGDYPGGCNTGSALGAIALNHLRNSETDDGLASHHLHDVALAWVERARSATPEEFETLRGQIVGFLLSVSPWVIFATKRAGQQLDQIDPNEMLKKANAGLVWVAPDDWD